MLRGIRKFHAVPTRRSLPRILVCTLVGATALTLEATPVSSAPSAPPNVEPRALEDVRDRGTATFWVVLREKADLAPAKGIAGRKARGEFVVDKLKATADRSQKDLKSLLKARGAQYRSFFIVNTLRVTGDEALLRELAARPEVKEIVADTDYVVPDPQPAEEPKLQAIEWNIERIRAPQAWSAFGERGEGIVVANIDTGVQYSHPALVAQYRGNLGAGSFDHNYNWFDPSGICGSPSTTPCDNNSHGTHTMGTTVGDDGTPGQNQIGVAPGARWIAAKGCESSTCSRSALLASGQWILAPTDLNGQNPRPDLRPHVVNNSWGGGGADTFYQATVDAWVASGIFPQFSNGNGGPDCQSSGAPGEYPSSYSAGAFDINDTIASFSSRGPSNFGSPNEIKPNIAAPGVSVRSAVPTNGFSAKSGTSMASPHVAGTVALMWGAAPSLIGDVAATRVILDDTAVDVNSVTCGGTADDNNVWGEGRLDALAAVDQSPRGPTGILQGTVTEADTGNPVSGAQVLVTGQIERTAVTGATGQYSIRLAVGTYTVRASAFGRLAQTVTGVNITDGSTVTRNFALNPAPSYSVSGHVLDPGGNPVQNARMTIVGTSIPAQATDANGFYRFPSVPEGQYDIRAEGGRCTGVQTQRLVVDGNKNVNFLLSRRTDSAGYFCETPAPNYVEADTILPLSGDDSSTQVNLPFSFTYYGQTYQRTWVSTNGHVNFLTSSTSFSNGTIPSTSSPNGSIYAMWDDLVVDSASSVRTRTLDTAPARRFVIEWRNVRFFGDSTRRIDLEIILHENGQILMQYRNIANDARERGNSATIGIEDQTGTVGLQYSSNEAVLETTFAILFRLPPSGFVLGAITDANDDQAIAGARVRALQSNVPIKETTTDSAGGYRLNLPLGSYTIEASKTNYDTRTTTVTIDQQDQVLTRDLRLPTARAEATPSSFSLIVPRNEVRTRTLTLRNTGTVTMNWQLLERNGAVYQDVPWLVEDPVGGAVDPGASQDVTVAIDTSGLAAGMYSAVLELRTNSGRQPKIDFPVSILVPAYYQAVNAGGAQYVEPSGDTWAVDRAYSAGAWGYTATKSSKAVSVTDDIGGTTEDSLYRSQRRDPAEYRFDGLPPGTYEIDLRFAEFDVSAPNKRLFDVVIENELKLPAHDIFADAGRLAADDHVFFMPVTDGQLNIRLVPRRYGWPVVNAIKVRHRPDR